MKTLIKNLLKKAGYQIAKYPDNDQARRIKIVKHYQIDTLLDIGANDGAYARTMRELGYTDKIISFEPLKSVFENLKKASLGDERWTINNFALGNDDMPGIINVSNNFVSSSILNILPAHVKNAPDSKYVGTEEIIIKKLDSIFDSFCQKNDSLMLKIDTQGFEKNVLDGAVRSLQYIKIIQLEMSISQLYENEMLFSDMILFLNDQGFQLFSLENGFADQTTGQLLQADGIFVNRSSP